MADNFVTDALDKLHTRLVAVLAPEAPVYAEDAFTGEPDRAITYRLYTLDFTQFECGIPGRVKAQFEVACYTKVYDPAWGLHVAAALYVDHGLPTRRIHEDANRETGYSITIFDVLIEEVL